MLFVWVEKVSVWWYAVCIFDWHMLTTSVYEKACMAGFSHGQGHCLLQDAAVKSEGKCNAVYMHRKYGTQNHRLEVSLSPSLPSPFSPTQNSTMWHWCMCVVCVAGCGPLCQVLQSQRGGLRWRKKNWGVSTHLHTVCLTCACRIHHCNVAILGGGGGGVSVADCFSLDFLSPPVSSIDLKLTL